MKKILVTESQLKRIIDEQTKEASDKLRPCKGCGKDVSKMMDHSATYKKNKKTGKSIPTYWCPTCFKKKFGHD